MEDELSPREENQGMIMQVEDERISARRKHVCIQSWLILPLDTLECKTRTKANMYI